MATVNFYLKNLKRNTASLSSADIKKLEKELESKETIIELRFRFDGKLFIYSTEIKIAPKLWDIKKQRIKSQATRQIDNDRLEKLKKLIEEIYAEFRLNSIIPSTEQLREELNCRNKKHTVTEKKFIEYFEQDYINYRSKEQAPKDRIKEATVKRYRSCIMHLKAFEQQKRYKLTFDSITQDFYNKYVNFLTSEYISKKTQTGAVGLEDNTVGNSIKSIKTFMAWAYDKGLHKNESYKDKTFRTLKHEDEEIVVLNDEELDKITALDLSDNERLSRVRDIFMLGVAVGARISDLLSLKQENLVLRNGTYSIKYVAQKTAKKKDKSIEIPISPEIAAITSKYEGKYTTLLPRISDVKFNVYIKELSKLAGLNEEIQLHKMIGSEKKFIKAVPKHEVISSHIMRRTFITQALKRGLPAQLVMECSGHSDYASFKRYINMSDPDYMRKSFIEKMWNKAS